MRDFDAESYQRRQELVKRLVEDGSMTEDQAASALGNTGTSGETPKIDIGNLQAAPLDTSGISTPESEDAELQKQREDLQRWTEERQARMGKPSVPSLSETLQYLSQNPQVQLSHKNNYTEAFQNLANDPESFTKWNSQFMGLSAEDKERVIERIGLGQRISTSFGKYHLNAALGTLEEITDIGNRWDSFVSGGAGLFRKDVAETARKWGIVGVVPAMLTKILVGTITGTVTGVIDIAKGDFTSESVLHVASMASLLMTGGASGVATVGKTASKALTKGMARKSAKALRDAMKVSGKWTVGGNIGGAAGRVSGFAQKAELVVNPEELPYELLGDYGMEVTANLIKKGILKAIPPKMMIQGQIDRVNKRIDEIEGMDPEKAAMLRAAMKGIVGGRTEEDLINNTQEFDKFTQQVWNEWDNLRNGGDANEEVDEDEFEDEAMNNFGGKMGGESEEEQEQDEATRIREEAARRQAERDATQQQGQEEEEETVDPTGSGEEQQQRDPLQEQRARYVRNLQTVNTAVNTIRETLEKLEGLDDVPQNVKTLLRADFQNLFDRHQQSNVGFNIIEFQDSEAAQKLLDLSREVETVLKNYTGESEQEQQQAQADEQGQEQEQQQQEEEEEAQQTQQAQEEQGQQETGQGTEGESWEEKLKRQEKESWEEKLQREADEARAEQDRRAEEEIQKRKSAEIEREIISDSVVKIEQSIEKLKARLSLKEGEVPPDDIIFLEAQLNDLRERFEAGDTRIHQEILDLERHLAELVKEQGAETDREQETQAQEEQQTQQSEGQQTQQQEQEEEEEVVDPTGAGAAADTETEQDTPSTNETLSRYHQHLGNIPGDEFTDPGSTPGSVMPSISGGTEGDPLTFSGAVEGDPTGQLSKSWLQAIEQKGEAVYNAVKNFTDLVADAQNTAAGPERDRKETQVEAAFGRLLEQVAPGIATEPTPTEGETQTQTKYIADETKRNEVYRQRLGGFLKVARDIMERRGDVDLELVDTEIAAIDAIAEERLGGTVDSETDTGETKTQEMFTEMSAEEQTLANILRGSETGMTASEIAASAAVSEVSGGRMSNNPRLVGQIVSKLAKRAGSPIEILEGKTRRYRYSQTARDAEAEAERQAQAEAEQRETSRTEAETEADRFWDDINRGNTGDGFGSPLLEDEQAIDYYNRALQIGAKYGGLDVLKEMSSKLSAIPEAERTPSQDNAIQAIGQAIRQIESQQVLKHTVVPLPDNPDIIGNQMFFKYETSQPQYKHLSNFALFGFTDKSGRYWVSLEQYFQASKFPPNSEEYNKIRKSSNPNTAWRIANENRSKVRKDFDGDAVMWEGIQMKYGNPTPYQMGDGRVRTLADMLVATEGLELIHIEHLTREMRAGGMDAPYWGATVGTDGRLVGQNKLGVMLMRYRQMLLDSPAMRPDPSQTEQSFSITKDRVGTRQNLRGAQIYSEHLHGKGDPEILTNENLRVGFSSTDLKPESDKNTLDFAIYSGLIENESELTDEVKAQVKELRKATQRAQNITQALGIEIGNASGVAVSGVTYGPDQTAATGTLSAGGQVIGAYPAGIEKRPGNYLNSPAQYYPNYPSVRRKWSQEGQSVESDPWNPNYVGVSLYPAAYEDFTRKARFDRNGLVAGLSDVVFVAAATDKGPGSNNSLSVDVALKALSAGRPVVVMDSKWFGVEIPGNEFLKQFPNVYVVPYNTEMALENGEVNGKKLYEFIKSVHDFHMLGDANTTLDVIPADLRVETETLTETELENAVRETAQQYKEAWLRGNVISSIHKSIRTRQLIRLLAERHNPEGKPSSSRYGHHSQLTETEKQTRLSTVGLHNYNSFEAFYEDLTRDAEVTVFVDTRRSTSKRVQDADGNWDTSWDSADKLAVSLRERGVRYVHALSFAPETDTRRYQQVQDEIDPFSTGAADRVELDASYIEAYYNQLKRTGADLGLFIKDTIARHLKEDTLANSQIIFACIENRPHACHRSLLGNIMSEILGVETGEVGSNERRPPGTSEDRTSAELPTPQPQVLPNIYSGRSIPAVQDPSLVPRPDSRMILSKHKTLENGGVRVSYTSPFHYGWEVSISTGEGGKIQAFFTGPGIDEEMALTDTEFLESINISLDKSFSEVDKPGLAELIMEALDAARANPMWFTQNTEYAAHPENSLVPNIIAKGSWGVDIEYRETADSVLPAGSSLLVDHPQSYNRTEETGQALVRRDETEHTQLHYKFTSPGRASNLRVRLSRNGKFLELASISDERIRLPEGFPPSVTILRPWSDVLNAAKQAGIDPKAALWEHLATDPRIRPGQEIAPELEQLPVKMRDAVKDAFNAASEQISHPLPYKTPEAFWKHVVSFIHRGELVRRGEGNHDFYEHLASQFLASHMPAVPNIPTQAFSYLAAAGRAIQQTPRSAQTFVLPVSKGVIDHSDVLPRSDETGQRIGEPLDDGDLDNIDWAQKQAEVDSVPDPTDETPGEPTPTSEGEPDDETETRETTLPETWHEKEKRITNNANDFMRRWRSGDLRVKTKDGGAFNSESGAAAKMIQDIRSALSTLRKTQHVLKLEPERRNKLIGRIKSLENKIQNTYLGNWDHLNRWYNDITAIREVQQDLKAAFDIFNEVGAPFPLQGIEITRPAMRPAEKPNWSNDLFDRLYFVSVTGTRRRDIVDESGMTREDTRSTGMRVVLTNSGVVVPIGSGSLYVIDPNTNRVYKRPSSQLDKAVMVSHEYSIEAHNQLRELANSMGLSAEQFDRMLAGEDLSDVREGNPQGWKEAQRVLKTLEDSRKTFFTDPHDGERRFEKLEETEDVYRAELVGTGLQFVLNKKTNEVTYLREGRTINISGWNTMPLHIFQDSNWEDTTQDAELAIVMATRDGLLTTPVTPLELTTVNLNPDTPAETSWDYAFKPGTEISFVDKDGNETISQEWNFRVSLFASSEGYRYMIEAFDGDTAVEIFGQPMFKLRVERNGRTRRPYEAIESVIKHTQKKAAQKHGWDIKGSEFDLEMDTAREVLTRQIQNVHVSLGETVESEENWETTYDTDVTSPISWKAFSAALTEKHGADVVAAIEGNTHPRASTIAEIVADFERWIWSVSSEEWVSRYGTGDASELEKDFKKAIPSRLAYLLNKSNAWDPPGGSGVRKVGDGFRKVFKLKGYPNYRATTLQGSRYVRVWFHGQMRSDSEAPTRAQGWKMVQEGDLYSTARSDSPWEFVQTLIENAAVRDMHLTRYDLVPQEDGTYLVEMEDGKSVRVDRVSGAIYGELDGVKQLDSIMSINPEANGRELDIGIKGVEDYLTQKRRADRARSGSSVAEDDAVYGTIIELPSGSESVGYDSNDKTVIERQAVRIFRLPDVPNEQIEVHTLPDASRRWDETNRDWYEAFGVTSQRLDQIRHDFKQTHFTAQEQTAGQDHSDKYWVRRIRSPERPDAMGAEDITTKLPRANALLEGRSPAIPRGIRYLFLEQRYREQREAEGKTLSRAGVLWRDLLQNYATPAELNDFFRNDTRLKSDEFSLFVFNEFLPDSMWTPLTPEQYADYRNNRFDRLVDADGTPLRLGTLQLKKKLYIEQEAEFRKTHGRVLYKDLVTGKYFQYGASKTPDRHTTDPREIESFQGGVQRFEWTSWRRADITTRDPSISEFMDPEFMNPDEVAEDNISDQLVKVYDLNEDGTYADTGTISEETLRSQLEARWRTARARTHGRLNLGTRPSLFGLAQASLPTPALRIAAVERWLTNEPSQDAEEMRSLQKEIVAAEKTFAESIEAYNENDEHLDPVQPQQGLRPNAIPLRVPNTEASIEVVGLSSDGTRHYRSSRHLLDMAVWRDGDTYTARVGHIEGLGTITVRGIPEEGITRGISRVSQMSPAARSLYQQLGSFQGDKEVALEINDFDKAAALATQIYFDHARDADTSRPDYPGIEIESNTFWIEIGDGGTPVQLISTEDALSPEGGQRLSVAAETATDQQRLRKDLSSEESKTILAKLNDLKRRRQTLEQEKGEVRKRYNISRSKIDSFQKVWKKRMDEEVKEKKRRPLNLPNTLTSLSPRFERAPSFSQAIHEISTMRNALDVDDAVGYRILGRLEQWIRALKADYEYLMRENRHSTGPPRTLPDKIAAVDSEIYQIQQESFEQQIVPPIVLEPRGVENPEALQEMMHTPTEVDADAAAKEESEIPEIDLSQLTSSATLENAPSTGELPQGTVARVEPEIVRETDDSTTAAASYTLENNPFVSINVTLREL